MIGVFLPIRGSTGETLRGTLDALFTPCCTLLPFSPFYSDADDEYNPKL